MQVRSLGGEDPLEEERATHSSILAQRIPWTVEPGRLQSLGDSQESDRTIIRHLTQGEETIYEEEHMLAEEFWDKVLGVSRSVLQSIICELGARTELLV